MACPLERELQGELYLSRWPSSRQVAVLRCSKSGCVVAVLGTAIREQEVGVIQNIKKLRTKFQTRLLRGIEQLEY